jgi:transcriptional regulator with XRE-family HTH domain
VINSHTVGDQLKSGRELKGWSQEQAALRLGVSQSYLSLLERGGRHVPEAKGEREKAALLERREAELFRSRLAREDTLCHDSLTEAERQWLRSQQDHRTIRKRWRAMQCFRSFHTAERTIEGIEAAHMLRKGQVKRLDGRDSAGQAKFVRSLFGVAA